MIKCDQMLADLQKLGYHVSSGIHQEKIDRLAR